MGSPAPNDFLDRVDDENRTVGLVRRGDVLAKGAGFRTVHVFVLDHNGRLLLQKISRSNRRSAGRWGSSVAGYVHAGEPYEVAARRRMEEEIGLTTRLDRVGVLRLQDEQSTKFVELFVTTANHATLRDASIEDLRYWKIAELERHLAKSPDEFTATFRSLYSFWSSTNK